MITHIPRITLLAVALLVPTLASATFSRASVQKPTRGNYENVADEEATRRNQFSSKASSAASKVAFKDLQSPFTFTYPRTWKPSASKTSVTLIPIYDQKALQVRRESLITLLNSPTSDKSDYSLSKLDKYFLSNATLSNQNLLIDWYIPSFNLTQSGSTQLLGKPARRYEYTGERASVKYKIIRIMTSFNGTIYNVSYMSKPETFDQDLPVFEEVLKTLKLKEKKATSSSSSSVRRRM